VQWPRGSPVDLPDPVPGDDEQLFDISARGVNFADTHHRESSNWPDRRAGRWSLVAGRWSLVEW